jgi:microcystin-dependent protein
MSSSYVGEIRMFGFTFAPSNWAFCNGQLLSISNFQVLFTLLGTTYGGDGQNTFALPNLQSRVPVHQGQGAGLSQHPIGQYGGVENVTLTVSQLPAHNHLVNATSDTAAALGPSPKYLGHSPSTPIYVNVPTAVVTMAPSMISIAGGNQPHTNVQPYLTVNFCISLYGFYPSQS